MLTRAPLVALTAAAAALPALGGGDALAIRVGRAETISHGTIEHAVILVEDGRITAVGQDLPVERGIPVLDRPQWTVMPGLVQPYSRLGLDGRGSSGFEPQLVPTRELYPLDPVYGDLLARGVTTLGLYPAGSGVPGQAIVLRPHGSEREQMLLGEAAYLKVEFRADSRNKKMIRDAFEKVDDYVEKEQKAREKWEKDVEKAKKDAEKKKDDEKKDEKKDEGDDEKDEGPGPYVPPEPDEKVKPFMALRAKELRALVALPSSSDYLHWLDAVGEEDFLWDLRLPLTRQADYYEIAERLGEKKVRVVMEPELSLQPGTMRQRNLPAELVRAGARLVLIPRSDSLGAIETWLSSVGLMVATGLDRQTALRAVTLEAAEVVGLADRVGSIEVGKDANLIFFSGDPLEPSTQLEAVMLEGEFVEGEVKQ